MAIAVVIPAKDEHLAIGTVLERVLAGDSGDVSDGVSDGASGVGPARPPESPGGGDPASTPRAASTALDVVVVDGGSRDATRELARAGGARVIECAPGRARQLQAGLEAATGEVVLFLHADTLLPRGWRAAVARALDDARCAAGAFALGFERTGATPAQTRALARIARAGNARARWLGLPFGDQALFARRSALRTIGGIPQAPLFEDVDLVWRLRGCGRVALLRECVETSPRRYLERGAARTVAAHAVALAGWALGAPRAPLARWLGR